MRHKIPTCLTCACISFLFASCGEPNESPILAGNTASASIKGEELFQEAKDADSKGKRSTAIKLYKKVADRYPFASSADQARFREAQLRELNGDVHGSFQAYDKFLGRYQASDLYSTALNRQADMAFKAANGQIKSSFLGLKSKFSEEKMVEMLNSVKNNAPRSKFSQKAQYQIGQIYQSNKKTKEAITAYRKLVEEQPESDLAPEALFLIGMVLLEEADRGNRNQATLVLSQEAFKDYLIQYPGHIKNRDAREFLKTIENKQILTTLSIAQFYYKTQQFEAAKLYYQEVLKRTSSGSERDEAQSRLKMIASY